MIAVATSLSSCVIDYEDDTDLSVKKDSQEIAIFLYSPTCGNSNAAEAYVKENYPRVAMRWIDIDRKDNRDYLKSVKKDYGLGKGGKQIDNPVICFGDQYISGWGYDQRQKLDVLIQRYLLE